ncbi:MAG: VWA domain-containing protein [Actinobacteria bacterium]|nr:VWA domain-containing protein [Actinomycetota bacterium]
MTFASPWLLPVLLLVPAVLVLALVFDRRRARYTVAFTNIDLLASVATTTRRRPLRWLPLALFLLALASASAALARPNAKVRETSDKATIVLLVDVSGSMRASDVKPTRLGAAQSAMATFADNVPKGVKLGLVSFSTSPDLLVIPTTDRTILHEGIDLLAPEAGTAIGDGLGMAVHVAQTALAGAPRGKDGKVPAAIVLLSDGAQTRGTLTPLDGAARAKAAGIRVFTVALGTKNGTLGFGPFGGYGFGGGFGGGGGGNGGRRLPVRPDPVTLAAIAKETDGATYTANSAKRVEAVYKELGSSIAQRTVKREVSSWFVGLAALLLVGSLGAARLTGEQLP